jgi:hypothetical protein
MRSSRVTLQPSGSVTPSRGLCFVVLLGLAACTSASTSEAPASDTGLALTDEGVRTARMTGGLVLSDCAGPPCAIERSTARIDITGYFESEGSLIAVDPKNPNVNFRATKDILIDRVDLDMDSLPVAGRTQLQGDICMFAYHDANPGSTNLFCSTPVITTSHFHMTVDLANGHGFLLPAANTFTMGAISFVPEAFVTAPPHDAPLNAADLAGVKVNVAVRYREAKPGVETVKVLRIPYLDTDRHAGRNPIGWKQGSYNLLVPNQPWYRAWGPQAADKLEVLGFRVYMNSNHVLPRRYEEICVYKRPKGAGAAAATDKRCLDPQTYTPGKPFPVTDGMTFTRPMTVQGDEELSASCYVRFTGANATDNIGGDCVIYPVVRVPFEKRSKYAGTQFRDQGLVNPRHFAPDRYCDLHLETDALGKQTLGARDGSFTLTDAGLGLLQRIITKNRPDNSSPTKSKKDWQDLPDFDRHVWDPSGPTLPLQRDYEWSCQNMFLPETTGP